MGDGQEGTLLSWRCWKWEPSPASSALSFLFSFTQTEAKYTWTEPAGCLMCPPIKDFSVVWWSSPNLLLENTVCLFLCYSQALNLALQRMLVFQLDINNLFHHSCHKGLCVGDADLESGGLDHQKGQRGAEIPMTKKEEVHFPNHKIPSLFCCNSLPEQISLAVFSISVYLYDLNCVSTVVSLWSRLLYSHPAV